MPAVMKHKPIGYDVPSIGVRFENPRLTSHLSMSSLGSTVRSSQDQWDSYNRQQIYKKVNDWFTEWRPWQQRMLLCGLTNRCSTAQLESLATTLEPLFHRDFVTSLRKRYPSAPFRRQKARELQQAEVQKKDFKKYARLLVEDIVQLALTECLGDPNDEETDKSIPGDNQETNEGDNGVSDLDASQEVQIDAVDGGALTKETLPKPEQSVPDVDKDSAEGNTVTKSVANDKCGTAGADGENAPQEAENAIEENKEEEQNVANEPTGNEDGDEALAVTLDDINEEVDGGEHEQEDELLFHNSAPKFDGPRKIFISRPFLSAFEYAQAEKTEPDQSFTKDNLGLLLTREHFSIENQQHVCHSFPQTHSAAGGRTHRHRSGLRTADVRATDFFERRMSRLGPLQAQLRTGTVRRPSRVGDIDTPVQRLFKHSKFWGSNPKEGNTFVRPKKSHLQWHFREQVKRVWEWIGDWEEWEKLNLLTNIVKLCDQDMLNYLTQCMIGRLRERVDISWLSDPLLLLIFSYLPSSDIESASRVCRRWRYLTSTNELWMIKCQEFGMDQGIYNILDLVKASGFRGQEVDWRLAYLELQGITEQARSSLPIPSRLAFEGPTPVGKRRVGGKFLSVTEPAKLRNRSTKSEGSRLSASTVISSNGLSAATAPSFKGQGAAKPPDETAHLIDHQIEGLESVYEKGTISRGPETSFPSRGVSRYQSEIPSPMKSEPPIQSGNGLRDSKVSGRKLKSRKEELPTEEGKKDLQGPLRQFRGKKKTDEDEDEPARDVRPELVQAKDVLHKSTITSKMWSIQDAKEARERLETYVGKVSPIRRARKLQGHMDAVLCIEFDARRLVSGGMDRAIRIWDIRSGRSLHKFYGHKGGVSCMKFDNETLYSGSWDTAIMVWDLVKFERIDVLTGHKGSISCLAMNNDYLFSGSHDGTIRMWQRSTLLCSKILENPGSQVLSMALSGPHIITGSSDKTVRITDFLTEKNVRTLRTPNPVDTLLLTGSLIMTGDSAGHVYLWNKNTGEAEVGIKAHDAPITRVAYHSNHIYTASSDTTVKEWDLMTMACVRVLQGHKGPVRDIKVSSKCMVSAGADGHIRVWDKVIPMFAMGEEQNSGLQVIDERNK